MADNFFNFLEMPPPGECRPGRMPPFAPASHHYTDCTLVEPYTTLDAVIEIGTTMSATVE